MIAYYWLLAAQRKVLSEIHANVSLERPVNRQLMDQFEIYTNLDQRWSCCECKPGHKVVISSRKCVLLIPVFISALQSTLTIITIILGPYYTHCYYIQHHVLC